MNFEWIDPFAKIERLQGEVSLAREQGRQETLRYIEREFGQEFPKALQQATYLLAERVAEEWIKPFLRYRPEYEAFQARRNAEINMAVTLMKPPLLFAQRESKLTVQARTDHLLGVTRSFANVYIERPFEYTVEMCAPMRNERGW